MIHNVTITGISCLSNLKKNRSGTVLLAFYNAEVNGFELKGCGLATTDKNGLATWPPKLNSPDGQIRSVKICDDQLRAAMLRAARDAYMALTNVSPETAASRALGSAVAE